MTLTSTRKTFMLLALAKNGTEIKNSSANLWDTWAMTSATASRVCRTKRKPFFRWESMVVTAKSSWKLTVLPQSNLFILVSSWSLGSSSSTITLLKVTSGITNHRNHPSFHYGKFKNEWTSLFLLEIKIRSQPTIMSTTWSIKSINLKSEQFMD